MAKKIITGNSLLDKLTNGPYVDNPNYNTKTKAGRSQPTVLLDTSAGSLHDDGMSDTANRMSQLSFTNRDLDRTIESVREDEDLGITLSPYNSEEELASARADAQSGFTQMGNALMRAGVGEVILGSLEGFGNIADGIINSVTGDAYGQNPYTNFMHEAKEEFDNNFKIYRENPDESFDISDPGWWWDNAVSVATTASLLIPAAGWARGLSLAGRATKLNKVGKWASNFISKGIAKGAGKIAAGDEFSVLNGIANKSARVNRAIQGGTEIAGTALLSRTGENYMEGRQVYEDVYENSKENLDNMPDDEFTKLVERNPEFADMSKDDIAKEIARQSANKTFYNDYWMLLMDIPQFKALGSLFGKGVRRASTASERIAAENVRRTFAGKTNEQLIKDNIWNRSKEAVKYALKNPKDSFLALELGEGFEELYQGIQSEKGMEVASKYFDPSFTPRTLSSYLSDGSIWEQFFWGSLGGIAFNKAGRGIQHVSNIVEGAWNKKHMTADQYQAWKTSQDKVAINKINSITDRTKQFLNEVDQIKQGRNPYNFVIDEATGQKMIKDGELVNETIEDSQKDLLTQEAVRTFIDDTTLDAVDNGVYDLMKEIVQSDEFDTYLTNNGAKIDGNDKALSKKVANRMEQVYDTYHKELDNVNNSADTVNPFVTIAAAREITRLRLQSQRLNDQIVNATANTAEANTSNEDFSDYNDFVLYNFIKAQIDALEKQKNDILNNAYKKGRITNDGETAIRKDINAVQEMFVDFLANRTTKGSYEAVKNELKDIDISTATASEISRAFNTIIDRLGKSEKIPPQSYQDAYRKQIELEARKAYNDSYLPITNEDYQRIYNDFDKSMDAMTINRVNDYIDTVGNYIRNAEDLDYAINRVNLSNTGNKKVDEALSYLRYGYQVRSDNQAQRAGQDLINLQLDAMIERLRKDKEKADTRAEEAATQGVNIPTDESLQRPTSTNTNNQQQAPVNNQQAPVNTNNQQNAQTDNQNSSTGGVQQTPIEDTEDTAEIDTSSLGGENYQYEELPINTSIPQPQVEEAPIIDTTIPVGDNPDADTQMTAQQQREAIQIAQQIETPELKAGVEAGSYVMQLGFKESGRLDEATNALANGDNSKYNALIKEVEDFLVGRGYTPEVAHKVAQTEFNRTVAAFAVMNSKSSFGKLAYQLARGFSQRGANKYSATELIEGKAQDEVTEEFLDEYINSNKLIKVDGINIINIQDLFNHILDNENIDKNTAAIIYNKLGQYIAKHDDSKYMFTGFDTSRQRMTANQFFNELNKRKSRLLREDNQVHISTIEKEARGADFRKGIQIAANGGKVEATLGHDEQGSTTHIDIDAVDNRGVHYKVATLRTVWANEDFTTIMPVSHYSGYRNTIHIDSNGQYSLDCDFLFNALLDKNDADGRKLLEALVKYKIKINQAIARNALGITNDSQYQKELRDAMTEEDAKAIWNHPLFVKAREEKSYIPYAKLGNDRFAYSKDKIIRFVNVTSNILFYNSDNYNESSIDNGITVDYDTMTDMYQRWKTTLYNNYTYTYQLQQALENNDNVEVKLNIPDIVTLNTIPENGQQINIKDNQYGTNPNRSDYTPLVFVNKDRHLIAEDGTDYGMADIDIQPYSMGFVVHKDGEQTLVSYCVNAVPLKGTNIGKLIQEELVSLVKRQFANTDENTHDSTYNDIAQRINDLFGIGGIFRSNNIKVSTDKENSWISIYKQNADGTTQTLLTFYKNNRNGATKSNAVGIYVPRLNGQAGINAVADNRQVTQEEARNGLNMAIKTIMDGLFMNRSQKAMTNNNGNGSALYNKDNGKFNINIGGQTLSYNSYADFILENGGFTTNVDGRDGHFVNHHYLLDSLSIDTRITDSSQNVSPENRYVTDTLFSPDGKRKTVDTEEVLKAAGVSQDKIDVLMGVNTNMPILTKRVSASELDNGSTNAYYSQKERKIYITAKGAAAMNGNPTNAIRLLLHENLHRLFHNKANYNQAERDRILEELQEVYDYTIDRLTEDRNNGRISTSLYDSIMSVFTKATSYDNAQTNMEEFLMETLTQPAIVDYLNKTNWKEEVSIEGIPQSKKSIFQRIMDILLNLLGLNSNNIRNNSILAKEYQILSRNNTRQQKTTRTAPTGTAINTRTTPPVEESLESSRTKLASTKQKIDTIRSDFESRITRSPNFATDHTYYLDGTPIDTSVTQLIHGKQDLGQWGVVASSLGNTVDEAARVFFDNGGVLPDNYKLPNYENEGDNSREELINNLNKLKEYLDNRFGAGKYGVITQEFPIGGTVEVNGETKTVAGTMDMLVYTENGDIYIFDFKTKRIGTGTGNFSEEQVAGYGSQVNIYRQLLENNYPELRGKIKIGGLIKFKTDYPAPNENNVYTSDANGNVKLNGEDIINNEDYIAPYLEDVNDKDTIVSLEVKDFHSPIGALPERNDNNNIRANGEDMLADEETLEELDDEFLLTDDIDNDNYDDLNANTDLINEDINNQTIAEIYATPIADGNTDNPYGVIVVGDMNEFIESFPSQYRAEIASILRSNELNFTCQ